MSYYRFRYEDGEPAAPDAEHYGVEGKYVCGDGGPVAIVARINRGQDWSAYVGAGQFRNESEEATLAYVAKVGIKLSREEAYFYFPWVEEAWRD